MCLTDSLQPHGHLACLAPLSMEIPRQEYWSGLPFPSLGDLPNPGIEPGSPAWQVNSLPLSHQGSPDTETQTGNSDAEGSSGGRFMKKHSQPRE